MYIWHTEKPIRMDAPRRHQDIKEADTEFEIIGRWVDVCGLGIGDEASLTLKNSQRQNFILDQSRSVSVP